MRRLSAAFLAISFLLIPGTAAFSQNGEQAPAEDEAQMDGGISVAVSEQEQDILDDETTGPATADIEILEPIEEEPEPPVRAPPAPTNVDAFDTPNSAGDSVTLTWQPVPDEVDLGVVGYAIMRSKEPDGPFEQVGIATIGASRHRDTDARDIKAGETYYFQVVTLTADEQRAASEIVSAVPEAHWFHSGRWFILILVILISGAILFNINRARRGVDLYIRRIAGLESVEEAIGRSTEMGKPVLYVPGIRDMDDIQTIASMSILSHVARLTAEYDTPILVPNIRAVVMSTAQEVVKAAYLDVGRPDAYNPENIRYLTDDQFGYVAGVDGIMIRDKPAANFFLGAFFAESLILAETGASTGAIQIAGTAMPSQLPFFVAACDYTLIGEELFAASAYLAREPMLLGSLKGQDWGKFVFMIAVLVGAIGATVVTVGGLDPDVWWNIASWFRVE